MYSGKDDVYSMERREDLYNVTQLSSYFDQSLALDSSTAHNPLMNQTGHPPPDLVHKTDHETPLVTSDMMGDSGVIWVPAHKHPQIAPSEFANWLKTQREQLPTRRSERVSRQISMLSLSHTSEDGDSSDESDEAKHLSTSPDRPAYVLDRHASTHDDSPVFMRQSNRTLLRRSAFSARGRGRGRGRRQVEPGAGAGSPSPASSETSPKPTQEIPAEGVHLYERPVSMSEWIDLGNAGVESTDEASHIVSRVHDAESLLYTQLVKDSGTYDESEQTSEDKVLRTVLSADAPAETPKPERPAPPPRTPASSPHILPQPSHQSQPLPPLPPTPSTVPTEPSAVSPQAAQPIVPLRRGSSISHLLEAERRSSSSWLGTLFGDAKKTKAPVDPRPPPPASHPLARVQSLNKAPTTPARKSSLASLFSRTRSLKPTASSVATTTTTTTTTTSTNSTTATVRSSLPKVPVKKLLPPVPNLAPNRLPINVERAIYRLSHFKLANPRRPLRHQVLISNFMFWYLSVIHITPGPATKEGEEAQAEEEEGKPSSRVGRFLHAAKKRREARRVMGSRLHVTSARMLEDDNDDDDDRPLYRLRSQAAS